MFKDLSLESRNIQTQNCAPIQCTVWPRNGFFDDFNESFFAKSFPILPKDELLFPK